MIKVKIGWKHKPAETIEAVETYTVDNLIFVVLENGLRRKIPIPDVGWFTTKKVKHEEAVN